MGPLSLPPLPSPLLSFLPIFISFFPLKKKKQLSSSICGTFSWRCPSGIDYTLEDVPGDRGVGAISPRMAVTATGGRRSAGRGCGGRRAAGSDSILRNTHWRQVTEKEVQRVGQLGEESGKGGITEPKLCGGDRGVRCHSSKTHREGLEKHSLTLLV